MGLALARSVCGVAAPTTPPTERGPSRDWQAFERIVASHQSRIWSLALQTLGEPAAAEQVLDDTFLTAWNGLPRLAAGTPVSPWLVGLCARSLRSRIRQPTEAPLSLIPISCSAPLGKLPGRAGRDWTGRDFDVDDGLRQAVAAAVASLPTGHRAAFVFGDLGELSCADLAAAWNVAAPVVRRRMHEARLCVLRAVERHQRSARASLPVRALP